MQIVSFTPEKASETTCLVSRTLRACNLQDYGADRIERIEEEHSADALLKLAQSRDILLAMEAGAVVGTASLQRNWVYAVFVDPQQQGRGVGRALMRELERIAGEKKVRRLGVYSSVSAVGFYQQIGFIVEATIESEEHGRLTEMSKVVSRE
jgi:ribosomal protein S18 acetylase RimI-like enzyme